MKNVFVLLLISPIIYIGLKNLFVAFFIKKNFCGSCDKCGSLQNPRCSASSDKK